MSQFMTYNYWHETFKPIKNNISKYPSDDLIHFETYGEEVEFVWTHPNENVWTEVDGDGGVYIIAGKHFVNRINYYITENPWTDENIEVPTWCYRSCDCMDDEQYEDMGYNPDCPECEDGSIDIPCDTVEDLKAIYGEDAPIVG